MQNNYNNQTVTYAGFWVRAAAHLIDGAIVFTGLLIVRLLMAGVMALVSDTPLEGGLLFQYTLKDIVLYLSGVTYYILCTYFTGTTLGKRAMNLTVVNADGSHKLPFLNVVYRETIGRFLCSAVLYIGYIMVGIDQEKRGFHDMLSDTRVIYEKKVKVYPIYRGQPVAPRNYSPGPGRPPMPGNYPPGSGKPPMPGNYPGQGRTLMPENDPGAGKPPVSGNPTVQEKYQEGSQPPERDAKNETSGF